jgi:hypothetical protein
MAMATDGLFFTKATTGDVRVKNRKEKKRKLAISAAAEKKRKLAISAAADGALTGAPTNEKNPVLSDVPEQDIQKEEEDRKKLIV